MSFSQPYRNYRFFNSASRSLAKALRHFVGTCLTETEQGNVLNRILEKHIDPYKKDIETQPGPAS